MSGDNSTEVSRKRSRGTEASTRKDDLERPKAILQGGLSASGDGYDIRLEQPIFDTVDGDEYDALESRQLEEARGFVVDGKETDESYDGGSLKTEQKKKGKEEEEAQVEKVNPSLKASATITDEGRLSSMFTCSSFNKGKETDDKVKCEESILDEVLAEVTRDDNDRERHKMRRKQP